MKVEVVQSRISGIGELQVVASAMMAATSTVVTAMVMVVVVMLRDVTPGRDATITMHAITIVFLLLAVIVRMNTIVTIAVVATVMMMILDVTETTKVDIPFDRELVTIATMIGTVPASCVAVAVGLLLIRVGGPGETEACRRIRRRRQAKAVAVVVVVAIEELVECSQHKQESKNSFPLFRLNSSVRYLSSCYDAW